MMYVRKYDNIVKKAGQKDNLFQISSNHTGVSVARFQSVKV
jgi:hypothetical protein